MLYEVITLALHRAILRTAMDGYWMLDLDGNILEVNDAYCRMSGYDAEELVRMHVSALDAEDAATGMMEHLHRIVITSYSIHYTKLYEKS